MGRPRLTVTSVTIGTPRPRELATFYSELLGWPISADDPPDERGGGWAQVRPPQGNTGPTLNFEHERHFRRPRWPSVPDEQSASQHLDIWVEDLEESVRWALQHGAVLAEAQPQQDVRVLIDPDGHPFCLFL